MLQPITTLKNLIPAVEHDGGSIMIRACSVAPQPGFIINESMNSGLKKEIQNSEQQESGSRNKTTTQVIQNNVQQ